MTNSFNPSLGVDTSKTNYLQTEVDMTEATNKQIDENVKLVDKHFDSLIKMHNDSIKANQKGWKELAQFTVQGVKFAKWARDKADAKAALDNYYNPDKVKSRILNEAGLDVDEAELEEQKRINYTAAGEIEALDPSLSNALKETGINRAQKLELLGIAFGQSGSFFEKAQDLVQAEVAPGVYKTWNEKGGLTAIERSIVSKEIDEVFITQLVNSGISRRLIDKYLLKPMLKQHEARLLTANAESIKADKEQKVQFRNTEFATKFRAAADSSDDPASAGAVIEDYLKDFAGYHAASSGMKDKGFFLAKQELQEFILSGLQNGEIDPDQAEGALGFLLTPNDGGKPRSIEEYLPQFARPIKKAITQARNDKAKEAEESHKLAIKNKVNPVLDEWRKRDQPPTEEEVQEFSLEIAQEFGEVPDNLKNFWSQQDIDDADLVFDLERRWVNGEEIRLEDLDGISDATTKSAWMTKVNSGGMSQTDTTRRDRFIKGLTLERLWDENADKTTSNPMYSSIIDQSTDYFTGVYRKERSLGQDHETAIGLAQQETQAKINDGSFDVRPLYSRNENRADNINSARNAIIKDNSVIHSESLWPGEEAELKAALRYVNTGRGNIPEYYRSFPFINLTPYELMQARLAATGTIKPSEVKPIPERELDPVQQDLLLNKPSPARTNRAVLDLEDKILLVELSGARTEEELLEILRANSERNNRTAGWEISQVNIDPSLEEEHTQVVGEQSPYMRLNTMLPGVATAYVEETYNV